MVGNVGSGLANDVTVKVRPPAGTTLQHASVSPDGTYSSFTASQNLAPGRYFVRVNITPTLDFTVPNTGEEATDSDVALTVRGYYEVTAESAVIDVVDGRYTWSTSDWCPPRPDFERRLAGTGAPAYLAGPMPSRCRPSPPSSATPPIVGFGLVQTLRPVPAGAQPPRCSSCSRSSTRRILPEMVFGSSSVNSISRGYL
jgi:hypothetical protein